MEGIMRKIGKVTAIKLEGDFIILAAKLDDPPRWITAKLPAEIYFDGDKLVWMPKFIGLEIKEEE